MATGAATAFDAIEKLRAIYCDTTGHDYNHVFVPEERVWLREAVETRRYRPPIDPINGVELLDRITQVETFERFLHRTFPGKTRFSIEGLDLMIPILDEIIHDAADGGVQHVMIAMAHRGRLNVLTHVLQKPYAQVLAEFKDPLFARSGRIDLGWMGDVKYHAGARYAVESDGRRESLVISMPPNPSHLEAVDPGARRAWRAPRPARVEQPGRAGRSTPGKVLAILIHGDAAFPGQGVVAETLNLSRLDGYQVGGIIHIIANNQLGFTADAEGIVQHELRQRAGARVQDSDHARQRGRSGGVHRGGAPGVGVSADASARFPDRSGRLPPLRAQRGRRAGVHAAGRSIRSSPAIRPCASSTRSSWRPTASSPRKTRESLVKAHMNALEAAYAALKPEQDYVPPLPVVPPSGAA